MSYQELWSFTGTIPFVGLFLRCRCARTELINPDLICPSTYQLLQTFGGDSRPDLSFDKSASLERLFSSACILPFPRVHFSQLGPLGLNKVITFEVLCRSLQIELTVTLFRVFQTFCKQCDWYSFSKSHAPSLACIDDNCSYMRHWKSGFFLIDRRAIPDTMVWRHLNAAIDDPRPIVGSFNMADVRRLSAHWSDAEVQEELHLNVRPTLQRLLFYCTPPAMANVVIPDPTLEDLAVSTPSSKIVAKAKASQKQKASTFGATLSYVAKRTRSALDQSSGSTTRPSLFVGDDNESDDDDACVEILLVTPLRFAVVIPSLGNQGGSFGVMVDDAAAPSTGVSQPRPSSRPAPSFRYVSNDAIHTKFFPFSIGPYYATYLEDGVVGNCEFTREEWDAP
ncbi:hypothetical protein Tco_1522306 [Tanacetum coccineum]